MPKNILLIGGSLNQTTMMHQIAAHLTDNTCYFSPFFDDGLIGDLSQKGLLDFTILGGRHRKNTEAYFAEKGLPVDIGGQARSYDLVITGTDLILPRRIRGKKLMLVQEGMTEPEGMLYFLVRWFGLPRFLANTASTGLSNAFDLFCVASAGYRDLFVRKGVRPEKIAVTGIPNYDCLDACLKNDFPHHHYVLAATSSHRETFHWDDRRAFIQKVQRIAAGREILFKLHPNENMARARMEIEQYAPEAVIYEQGNTYDMIANCDVLVTQTSSVTFVGLALNKEVHSDLDLHQLRQLLPIQNGGTSALRIAELCEQMLNRTPLVPVPTKALSLRSLSQKKVINSL
jgi:hypothetical protein